MIDKPNIEDAIGNLKHSLDQDISKRVDEDCSSAGIATSVFDNIIFMYSYVEAINQALKE